MKNKFVVKLNGEIDAQFIETIAFEKGWKWFDDDRHDRNLKSGQKVKNTHASYIYFGYKGEGLMSWGDKVNRSVPPGDVFNARIQLKQVIGYLEENEALYVGADSVEIDDGKVTCACKTFKGDFVQEITVLANDVRDTSRGITFHANGDVSVVGRRVSNYLLNKISEQV